MRRPIFHVGWFSACSTVIDAKSDRGVFRNGPPDAVSQMRSTSSIRPPRRHWWTALCSLSIGSRGLPCLRASAVINSPAATRHFARPHCLVGCFKSCHSHDRAHHKVDVGMGRNTDRARAPVNHFDFAQAFFFQTRAQNTSICLRREGDHPRMPAACLLKRSIQVAARSQGYDLESIRVGFGHTERASADRASRSQDGNAFHQDRILILRVSHVPGGGRRGATASHAKLHSTTVPGRRRAGHQYGQACHRGREESPPNLSLPRRA